MVRRKSRHSVFLLSRAQQIGLLIVLAAIALAGVMSPGISQVGTPAGQQFAPVVGGPDRCFDSDGVDYSSQGTVTNVLDGAQKVSSDYCASSLTLAEYYCSGNVADVVLVDCPRECAFGRCR